MIIIQVNAYCTALSRFNNFTLRTILIVNPVTIKIVPSQSKLMKLINRQTGNNCYEILKEYKGGFNARVFQTVAFVFGSNLKQSYDPQHDDQAIESIVREVERMYGRR